VNGKTRPAASRRRDRRLPRRPNIDRTRPAATGHMPLRPAAAGCHRLQPGACEV